MDCYQRYGRAILAKAVRILGNREDARDVVQDLFVDLYAEGKSDVNLPYLYRAVTNRCLNLLRNEKTRMRLIDAKVAPAQAVYRRSCEGAVIEVDMLAKLMGRLDRMGQEILIYYYMDDMSQEEVATMVETSRKTVGVRLGKIRDELIALEAEKGAAHP